MSLLRLKITFISGLQEIVLEEIASFPEFTVIEKASSFLIVTCSQSPQKIFQMRSVLHVYLIQRDSLLNPSYLAKHKSILGNLIQEALKISPHTFKTFTMSCAGNTSPEVKSIYSYLEQTYRLTPYDNPDLKIYNAKMSSTWELGVSITSRPLSLRPYKEEHIAGGINPTVAYAMQHLCTMRSGQRFLNICSGSATLLIEAALLHPDLEYVGFDNNKQHITQAIRNIKKAGLIKKITIHFADIYDNPSLGMFNTIVADLPFGMQISKHEDLKKLYENFIHYTQQILIPGGDMILYTTEYDLLISLLETSQFKIVRELRLTLVSSLNSYLYPSILHITHK